MTAEPVVQALSELFSSYGAEGNNRRAAKDVGDKLAKRKDLKEAFAPLSRYFKYGVPIERIVQLCVEQPYSHPLHRAAAALLTRGEVAFQPLVALTSSAQPKRWTTRLMPSLCAPVVYAIEDKPQISVWSVETGAHLLDLKVPAGKGSAIKQVVELKDGTLRAITNCGLVSERAPAAAAFSKRYEVGTTKTGWLASRDLRYHVQQPEFQPEHTKEGDFQTLRLHDIETGKKTELRIAANYLCNRFFAVTDTTVAIGGYRSVEVKPDEWHSHPFLLVIDLVTQKLVQHPIPRPEKEVWLMFAAQRPGHVGIELNAPSLDEDERIERIELDLATGKLAKAGPEVEPELDHGVRFAGGKLTYHPRGHTVTDAKDRVVGGYAIAGDPYNTLAAYDALRDRLIVAGSDPETPVYILVPYDAKAAQAAEAAPAVSAAPLEWAKKGAVLRYAIADYDVADTYEFEVMEAGEELVLAIRMGRDNVAEAARFSAAALDGATEFVVLAQGGADVDFKKPVTNRVPPILLSRAMAKKLADKKKLAYQSEWMDKVTLENATRGLASVQVNGSARPVAAITATSDQGATVVVLADERWPLLLERVEDDCHVRLLELDLEKATTTATPAAKKTASASSPPTAKKAAAAGSSPSAAGAQRFEFVEGGSAKFWEIAQSGGSLTVRFGKLGTAGQTQVKDLGSEAAAQREAEKLIREKTKKGYAPA